MTKDAVKFSYVRTSDCFLENTYIMNFTCLAFYIKVKIVFCFYDLITDCL